MRKRDKAYQLAVLTKKPTDYYAFHQLRNKVSNKLDTAKSRHVRRKLARHQMPAQNKEILKSLD